MIKWFINWKIRRFLKQNKQIHAIKYYRLKTNCSLSEAVYYIRELAKLEAGK